MIPHQLLKLCSLMLLEECVWHKKNVYRKLKEIVNDRVDVYYFMVIL